MGKRSMGLALAVSAAALSCAGCVHDRPRITRVPPQELTTADALASVDHNVRQQLSQMYLSREAKEMRKASCMPEVARDDLLGRYFESALNGDVDEASRDMYGIHSRLACVSAEEFRNLNVAFANAAFSPSVPLRRKVAAEVNQILAPVALLIYEYAGPEFKERYVEWFRRHRRELAWAVARPQTKLGRLGLAARWGDYLMRLKPREAILLLAFFDPDSWGLGPCQVGELLMVPGESRLFCPRHCYALQTLLDRMEPDLQGVLRELFPEFSICDRLQGLRTKSGGLKGRLLGCLEAYAAGSTGGPIACLREVFDDRSLLGLFGIADDLEYELRMLRNCAVSTGESGEPDPEPPDDEPMPLPPWLEELLDEVFPPTPMEGVDPADGTPEGAEASVDWWFEVLQEHTRDVHNMSPDDPNRAGMEQTLQRAIKGYLTALDHLRRMRKGTPYCAPDSPDCPNECGHRNELFDGVTQCFQPEEPEGEDPPRRRDEAVTMPDPRKPLPVTGAVRELFECMEAAYDEYRSPANSACASTDCGSFLEPCGEDLDCHCCGSDGLPAGFRHPCTYVLDCSPLDSGAGEGGASGRPEMECTCGPQPVEGSEGPHPSPEGIIRFIVREGR